MHRFWGLLALAAVASPALAAPAYRASGFLRTGYSEKLIAPGQWAVRGTGREPNKSVSVALYRAAELAAQAGATELRVTRQHIKSEALVERRTGYQRSYHETAEVNVRVVRTEADRSACEMPQANQCMTLPVSGLLATYGPRLGMVAALPGQPPTAPLRIVTTSPQQRALAEFLAKRAAVRMPVVQATTPARAVPAAAAIRAGADPARVPVTAISQASGGAVATDAYAAALRSQQPVTHGPGWKISD